MRRGPERGQGKDGKDVKLIWVDSDGFLTAAGLQGHHALLRHEADGPGRRDGRQADKDGKFTNTPYVGTLANDGVQLAPFHDLATPRFRPRLKSELDQIKKDISGKLKVESAASPKA